MCTTHDAPAPDVATILSGATDVCSSSSRLIIHPLCVVRARVRVQLSVML